MKNDMGTGVCMYNMGLRVSVYLSVASGESKRLQ